MSKKNGGRVVRMTFDGGAFVNGGRRVETAAGVRFVKQPKSGHQYDITLNAEGAIVGVKSVKGGKNIFTSNTTQETRTCTFTDGEFVDENGERIIPPRRCTKGHQLIEGDKYNLILKNGKVMRITRFINQPVTVG